MFGRKKPAGEPTPASGRVRPDASVLDELSRAFGAYGDADDNAALIDDRDDATAAAEIDPLDAAIEFSIVTSDGPRLATDAGPPTPLAERRTIKIGDGFDLIRRRSSRSPEQPQCRPVGLIDVGTDAGSIIGESTGQPLRIGPGYSLNNRDRWRG
jgi:hypothetical protein